MIRMAFILIWFGGMAMALAPEASLRPVEPDGLRATGPRVVAAVSRPDPAMLSSAPNTTVMAISAQAAGMSLRPSVRPNAMVEKAMAKRRAKRRGAVCGDLDIQGEVVGLVPGRIRGCGIKNAVRVRSISGVGLTQKSLMNCKTAKALKSWVDRSAKPAFANRGGGLRELKVAAHYACRTRNNQPGAKISEHGKGRAVDISGFYMNSGEYVTVLRGWTGKGTSKALQRMYKGACGPFGTVLGPNSDRYHRDHFHFDTASYRSGPYCR